MYIMLKYSLVFAQICYGMDGNNVDKDNPENTQKINTGVANAPEWHEAFFLNISLVILVKILKEWNK